MLLLYPIKELNKIQQRATIWILGAFYTFPFSNTETIVGLVPIKLHLQKLSSKLQLRAHSLLSNRILKFLLETNLSSKTISY